MRLLALFYGIFIGIGLITAITHCFVGLRRRPRDPVHLSFALMTLLMTGVVLLDSGYRIATTADQALVLLNWGIALTALALVALIWFVAFYTAYVPRRFLAVMTALYAVAALASIALPTGALYAGDIQLERYTLPWGESFVQVSGTASNWQFYNIAVFLTTFIYVFYAVARQFQAGERRAALTLLAGLGFVAAGTVYDFLLDFGVITQSIGLYPISYIGLIVVMSLGLANDVVRTGIVQSKLLENERRWRTLLDGIEQLVVGLDLGGRVEYVNPYFSEATGYLPADVVGKDWISIFIPLEEQPRIRQAFADLMKNGLHRHHRNDIVTRGGETRTIAWSNVRLREVDGSFIGSLSVGQDITDQLAAAAALERHQQALAEQVAARTADLQRANLELDREHQAAERRRRTAEGFASILTALNTDRPLEEILAYLTIHTDRLLGSDASVVATEGQIVATTVPEVQDELDRAIGLEAFARASMDGEPMGYAVQALRADQTPAPLATTNTGSDQPGTSAAYRSVLAVPLVLPEGPEWGMLLYYREEQCFTREDLDNATILQGQLQLAIENALLRGRIADQAVAKERNRLSRELHDSVTQNLYTISTLAEVMPDLVESHPEELQRAVDNLRLLANGALAEMRALLLELRPSALLERNLGELLQQLADGLQSRTRTKLTVSVVNDRVFPHDVQVALYRITQEALNNVIKHAVAEHAIVGLYCNGNNATLRIHDDGQGFSLAASTPGRFGLENLRERARQIQAALDISSKPGAGTEITIIWSERGVNDHHHGKQLHSSAAAVDSRVER